MMFDVLLVLKIIYIHTYNWNQKQGNMFKIVHEIFWQLQRQCCVIIIQGQAKQAISSSFSIINFNHLWLVDFRLSEKSKLHEKLQYPILMVEYFLPFFLYAVYMRLNYFSLSIFKREKKIRLCLIQFNHTDKLNKI